MEDLITAINQWADDRNLKQADPKNSVDAYHGRSRRNSRCTLETDEIHRTKRSAQGCNR